MEDKKYNSTLDFSRNECELEDGTIISIPLITIKHVISLAPHIAEILKLLRIDGEEQKLTIKDILIELLKSKSEEILKILEIMLGNEQFKLLMGRGTLADLLKIFLFIIEQEFYQSRFGEIKKKFWELMVQQKS